MILKIIQIYLSDELVIMKLYDFSQLALSDLCFEEIYVNKIIMYL